MEFRKIQVTGESTYIISLPKKWVEENKLNKGDSLLVEEKGENLSVRMNKKGTKATGVDIKDKNKEFLARLLITKYIKGFDSVTFKSDEFIDPGKRKHLKKASRYLIGMEPFGETSKEMVFRMLMHEDVDLISTVSRMHEMSFSVLKEVIKELQKEDKNTEMLESIKYGDDEIDKFYFLLLRQLSKVHGSETIAWVQIVKSIERLSDHIQLIATLALEGVDFPPIEEYEFLIELYGEVMLALRSGHLKMAEEVIEEVERFRDREKEMVDQIGGKEEKTILIHESFRRIGEYTSDIAEGVINLY